MKTPDKTHDKSSDRPIVSVAVYCGGSENMDEQHKEDARAFARHLAKRKMRLIYGAGSKGVMGAVGGEMIKQKGEVWGVITRRLIHVEQPYSDLDRLEIVESMSSRKAALCEYSDALVVFPGGLGTLEEFFDVLSAKQLGKISKPIIIYNARGYWKPLIDLVQHLIDNNAVRGKDKHCYEVVDDLKSLIKRIDEIEYSEN